MEILIFILSISLIILGFILKHQAFKTLKSWQLYSGVGSIIIGVCSCVSLLLSCITYTYSYKTSEYKTKIIHQTVQKGNQIVCDTIYEFKKK